MARRKLAARRPGRAPLRSQSVRIDIKSLGGGGGGGGRAEPLEGRRLMSVATWDGGSGVDANWSTAANWVGDVAPSAGDDLVFDAGASAKSTTNDFAGGTAFASITIRDDGYTLAGNPVTLTGGGVTYDAGTGTAGPNTVAVAIALNGSQAFRVNGTAGGATLGFVGAVSSAGNADLTLDAVESTSNIDLAGAISISGSLAKTGDGGVSLLGTNTYSGNTTVADGAGALYVNNGNASSQTGSGAVSIGVNAELRGNGRVGNVTVSGSLLPGAAVGTVGTLRTGSLILTSGATYGVALATSSSFDRVEATGTISLGNATLQLSVDPGFSLVQGESVTIIANDGSDPVVGTFAGLAGGDAVPGLAAGYKIRYDGGDGNDVEVVRNASPDDETAVLAFSAPSYSVNESGGTLTVSVVRTGSTAGTVTVNYRTEPHTISLASARHVADGPDAQDYATVSGTLTFGPGETVKTFDVPILDDGLREADESFLLKLDQPSTGATVGSNGDASAVVVVVNDDPNAAPVAVDDVATGVSGQAVPIDVLVNDSDADNRSLSVEIASEPSHGIVQVVGGRIDYTAAAGFSGVDTFTYLVIDGEGGTDTGTVTVVTGGTAQLTDPADPTKTVLVTGGTTSADKINFVAKRNGQVQVIVNGQSQGLFNPTGRVVVGTGAGNDKVAVGKLAIPVQLDGGEGNDTITGTRFNDVLIGGPGDDRIAGGGGRDILIGAGGADRLAGGADDDILVGGNAAYPPENQSGRQAMQDLLAVWASGGEYAARVTQITTGAGELAGVKLGGETILDDGIRDTLAGDAGRDLFFSAADSPSPELLKGKKKDETAIE